MYAWLWRHLPGPLALKITFSLSLFFLIVIALFAWIFPWLEPRLPFASVTVDAISTGFSTHGDGLTSM